MNTQLNIALIIPYIFGFKLLCELQVRQFFLLLIVLAFFWLMVLWSIVQTFLTTWTITPVVVNIIQATLFFLKVSKSYLEVLRFKFV